MDSTGGLSDSTKTNFHVNVFNFVIVLLLIATGLVLQMEYHLHRLPDDSLVMGLNRTGWLFLHKFMAVIAVTGLTIHCLLHSKYIVSVTKKIMVFKRKPPKMMSYYLFILCIPTCFTAIISWLMFGGEDHTRFMLVEIHDKLALVFILITAVHIISRIRWMVQVYSRMKSEPAS